MGLRAWAARPCRLKERLAAGGWRLAAGGWRLAEYANLDVSAGLQHLLDRARWEADEVRDDLQEYMAERLGEPDGMPVIDETGFLKKDTASAGVQRQ